MKYLAFGLQVTAAITLTAGMTHAQQIRVAARSVIAEGTATRSFREPHLAINPQNSRHLVVATIVPAAGETFIERSSRQICAAFTSFDSGITWSRHDFDVTWCFDPWVVITPDNQVLVTVLAEHARFPQQGRAGLLAYHSPDGGRTWDPAPVGLGTPHDHPTMSLDLSMTSRRGFIYVLSHHPVRDADGARRWTIFVSRSRDGGKTFDEPVNILRTTFTTWRKCRWCSEIVLSLCHLLTLPIGRTNRMEMQTISRSNDGVLGSSVRRMGGKRSRHRYS